MCDQPHPEIIQNVLKFALQGKFSDSCTEINQVFNEGYNLVDIVNTITRVIQNSTDIPNDQLRLNFLKEASIIKMRTLKGNRSLLQLHGFISKLCQMSMMQNQQ